MADLIKVSITGAMPSGEVWSINPVWRLNGAPVSVSAAQCTAIVTAVNAITVPTGVRNMMSVNTTIVGCRVEARDVDGTLDALAEGTRALALTGSGSQGHPFQTSAVVSLRSPLAGASGRGRLYIPATGVAVDLSTLRLTSANVTSYLAGIKSYLGLIESAVTSQVPSSILAVWSRTLLTTLGVTRIQMGDVLDTQRRRRDAAIENYTELAYP